MSQPNVQRNDNGHVFHGAVTFVDNPTFPDSSIAGTKLQSATPAPCNRLKHQYQRGLEQNHGSAAVAQRVVVHRARGAGTVAAIDATAVVAPIGAATVTIDLYKNGASILSATFQITSALAAFGTVSGVILTAGYVAGDIFEVVMTVAAGGGTLPQGVAVEVTFQDETAN